jgi:ATP-dependent exoDNAse (exonuclease V) alpha subunit
MAACAELERVRRDPVTVRRLAKRLIGDPYCEDSEFADGFLENIANWKRDEITLRQAEVLLDLRDSAEIHTHYKGLSIQLLIEKCYANRYELDEVDRKRLEAIYEKGQKFVTGVQMGWFKRICKKLGEMEDYM